MKYIIGHESVARRDIDEECECCGSRTEEDFYGEHASVIDEIFLGNNVDCFDEYLEKPLKGLVKSSSIEVVAKDGKLFTEITYETYKKLSQANLRKLQEYTYGQMSDGIGEGFEQFPCNSDQDLYFSMWVRDGEKYIK